MINLYEILGIKLFCDDKKCIRQSYLKLVKEFHPDKNPDSKKESTEKFQEVDGAYKILSNDITKSDYDQKLKKSMKPATVVAQKKSNIPNVKKQASTPMFTFSYKEQGAYGAYISINQKKENPRQYKRLINEIINLPHTEKIQALKKIKNQLNYFYDKNEEKVAYETLIVDLESHLKKSLYYSHASIAESRYHFFPLKWTKEEQENIPYDIHGLRGDALKTAILTQFKSSIQNAVSEKDLWTKVNTFKLTPAYNKLATGQGLITTMFRLKTSSVVAFEKIVDEARNKRWKPIVNTP